MDWANYRAPTRASRAELLRALYTVPGTRFRVQGENTAYVFCPVDLVEESRITVKTAASIKGFGVSLGDWDGEGYTVNTESR